MSWRTDTGTLHFEREDGPGIKSEGAAFRKTSLTWVLDPKMTEPFVVHTAEGEWMAAPGDLLCYDEASGNVWSINPSYRDQNYTQVGMEPVSADDPSPHVLFQALEALSAAARHLSATDVANAEVNLAEPRYRPLTQLCAEAAQGLHEYLEAEVGIATPANVGMGHDAPVLALSDNGRSQG